MALRKRNIATKEYTKDNKGQKKRDAIRKQEEIGDSQVQMRERNKAAEE